MIRVLYVDHAEALGGAERSLLLLMKHLDTGRFQPLLACNPGPLAEAAGRLDLPVLPIQLARLRGEPSGALRLLRGGLALAGLIRRERVDIVHSNVMRASFYSALAARLTSRPLVWHVRDIHPPNEGWYPKMMCRMAGRAIAISHAVAEPLPCPAKVTVVYNGLDLDQHPSLEHGAQIRAELGLPVDAPLAGIVGRLRPWKGQERFLRAAALVKEQLPGARFVVVGGAIFADGSDYEERLHQLADDLQLADQTVFTGHREDIPRLLPSLDVLVHCSDAEPFGRVLIEGMAAGRPVVAFAAGAVPEIVEHGETGLLVKPGDERELARAILALLRDREGGRRMGIRGRLRVSQHFTAAQTARSIEAVYDSLLIQAGNG